MEKFRYVCSLDTLRQKTERAKPMYRDKKYNSKAAELIFGRSASAEACPQPPSTWQHLYL